MYSFPVNSPSPTSHSHTPVQDIRPWWDSIIKTLDYNIGLSRFAGPDKGFNDLDMLYGGWVGGRAGGRMGRFGVLRDGLI